jgi:hypothetical protein
MKIVCFIASHITPYRYITIKKAINSINDMVQFESNENYKMELYVSFSYDETITDEMIDTLIDTSNTECKHLNIFWYKHDIKKFQFEHIKHIVDNNKFTFDTWIMFQDDDDISMKNRLKNFIDSKCYLYDYSSYSSFGVISERTYTLNPSQYNEIELYNNDIYNTTDTFQNKEFKSISLKRDFATKIVNYIILYKFFKEQNIEYNRTTDVHFSVYINGFYKEYYDNKINYIINLRLSTDEQYIELYNNKMI